MILGPTPFVSLGLIASNQPRVEVIPPPIEEGGDLKIMVGGLDVSQYVLQDSVEISRTLDNRGTMRFGLRDDTRLLHYQPGQDVYAYWGSTTIFGGKIESVDESLPRWEDGPLLIEIDVTDWSRLFDRFLVAAVYEMDDPDVPPDPPIHPDPYTLAEIVEDIVTEQTSLDVEGITIGTMPAFEFNGKVKFKYQRAADCLRDLCQLAGCSWMVSPTKILHVYNRMANVAPWTIGDGIGALETYRNLRLRRTIESYRNTQWLLGGKDISGWLDEYFHGDTTTADPEKRSRTFTLAYPMASCIPVITRSGGPEPGVQIHIGIRGVDKDGDLGIPNWARWFYKVGEKEISQNSASDETLNPTLAPNETLQVHYRGQFDVVVEEVDEDHVSDRVILEGGSGIYEEAEEDQQLDTRDFASERARRLLEQFGRIPNTLQYQVDLPNIEPGMLQSIVLNDLDIDAQFLVEEIRIVFPRFDLMRVDITALDGERQEGWTEFWRRTMKTGRIFSIRENEIIAKYSRREENLSITDSLKESIHDTVTVPGIFSDPYTVALLGIFTIPESGGVTVGLTRIGWSKIGAPTASP